MPIHRFTLSTGAKPGCLLGLVLQLSGGFLAAAQPMQASLSQVPAPLDRPREIALALSACPQAVAADAAVYVLENAGYVKVRDSRNGFTAIVQHSLPTSQEPQCIDAEGSRTFLPRILKVAELRAQGKSSEEIKRVVADATASGLLHGPTQPGITYMLSEENLIPNKKGVPGPFPPHLMFYGPYLTNSDIGSTGDQDGPVFIGAERSPFALMIVPVGKHAGSEHPKDH